MTWRATFEPLIGKTLEGFALKPIIGDLTRVVSELAQPTIWYSGAIRLGFSGCSETALTWKSTTGGDCYLAVGTDESWRPFSLADLPMGFEERWAGAVGAVLSAVSIYRLTDSDAGVGAVCQQFSNSRALWVAVGREESEVLGEGDDLCVSLKRPNGMDALSLSETIGSAA